MKSGESVYVLVVLFCVFFISRIGEDRRGGGKY